MSANRGAYLMARLTTKGIEPGMPFGGKPELEKMDIAAACSRLDTLSFHLVMAKYCDDVKSALKAVGELQDVMCRASSQWAEMDPFKRSAAACALIEEFVSSRRCRRCKGTGELVEQERVVTCAPCQGSGNKAVSATSRAEACGIPESTFRHQRLNERYQEMMRYLSDLELTALERVSRKAS